MILNKYLSLSLVSVATVSACGKESASSRLDGHYEEASFIQMASFDCKQAVPPGI